MPAGVSKSHSIRVLAILGIAVLTLLANVGAEQRGAAAKTASAEIKNADGKTIGRAELRETPHGVLVRLGLNGAPAGVRALHIHETGRCDAPTFESAGAHYNPAGASHGFENLKGPHAGDLPNLHVPSAGNAEVEVLIDGISLAGGQHNLLDDDGSALVLHEGPDDYSTDPAGGAGKRLACGVITAAR